MSITPREIIEMQAMQDQPQFPKLDDSNFSMWHSRMKAHLRSKDLFHVCLSPQAPDLTPTSLEKDNRKISQAVDIIMRSLSNLAFETIINPENDEHPHLIWNKINDRYASKSFNNRGCLWLKFMRMEYRGDLKNYIQDCRNMMTDMSVVLLGVPEDILCFTILSKLTEDMWQTVDSIMMNEDNIKSPEATLSKLQELVFLDESRMKKSTQYKSEAPSTVTALFENQKKNPNPRCQLCKPGHHNPKANHPEEKCWSVYPKIHPNFNKPATQSHLTVPDVNPTVQSATLLMANCLKTSNPTVLDCGASHHMINFSHCFTNLKPVQLTINTGNNNNQLMAAGIGDVVLKNHIGNELVLKDTLYVPELNRPLISLSKLFSNIIVISKLNNSDVVIKIDNCFFLSGKIANNLLELSDISFEEMKSVSTYLTVPSKVSWHLRLGHPSDKYLNQVIPNSPPTQCETCSLCKMTKQPFSNQFEKATSLLEIIHLDLVGPFSVQSTGGALYFLTIVDQYSGYKHIKFLKQKSDTLEKFLEFKLLAENQLKTSIKRIVSDGGGEFCNSSFKAMVLENGIDHIISPPYTPQHNPFAERANRTILDKARCLLYHSKLPMKYWAEAINSATDLSNILPSKTGDGIPYEIWHGKKPQLDNIRPFGCLVYVYSQKDTRSKLQPTSEKGILLGFVNDFTSYKILKLSNKSAVHSTHVKFDENCFPGL